VEMWNKQLQPQKPNLPNEGEGDLTAAANDLNPRQIEQKATQDEPQRGERLSPSKTATRPRMRNLETHLSGSCRGQ
jgi:hypothetical protein